MGAKTVLAIDPGTTESGFVIYEAGRIASKGMWENSVLTDFIAEQWPKERPFQIESMACYGMPVGVEVFEAAVWSGRMIHAHDPQCTNNREYYMYRKTVTLHLCSSHAAKDSTVRAALIHQFGPGKDKAIGKKKTPGPLYGVVHDIWSALAVAVTWAETRE